MDAVRDREASLLVGLGEWGAHKTNIVRERKFDKIQRHEMTGTV